MRRRDLLTVAGPRARPAPPLSDPSARLTEEDARRLADRVLRISRADETSVRISGGRRRNTRYAVNRITTAGDSGDLSVAVTARFGRRSASVSTNEIGAEGLEAAMRQAEELARVAPEDPEAMPLLGPQEYLPSDGWFDATAGLDAERRSEVAAAAIEAAEGAGVTVAGFMDSTAGATALANSAGLFAYHAETSLDYTLTARTPDGSGSGWAGIGTRNWASVKPEAMHRRAVGKAIASREPRPLEPGTYTVVLEPSAVADLVGLLAFSLDARTAAEGRSAFSAPGGGTRIGEQIVDSRVTLRSDPQALGAVPFDGSGLPLVPITWIENGVLKRLSTSRFWAAKEGVEPTGPPSTVILEGGEGSVEDLIAGTERGLLVTRLWYIRSVDPRTILFTGLTRDGTFLIEGGKITAPVNNFRWNDSPLLLLQRLDAIGRSEQVTATRRVPPLRAREFHMSSVSEAV